MISRNANHRGDGEESSEVMVPRFTAREREKRVAEDHQQQERRENASPARAVRSNGDGCDDRHRRRGAEN